MCRHDPLFEGNDQRDAHDFLSAFLFAARKEFKNPEDSPFSDLFFGKEQAVIKCNGCKNEVLRKDEIFSSLTLTVHPNQPGNRLQTLIANAYGEQRIEWDCNRCKSKSCTRKVFVEAFPKILIIHFNRYVDHFSIVRVSFVVHANLRNFSKILRH
nr:ubiquitin carboxyl-terminal hydrolase 29-like [Penaeus vannamei]